MIRSVRKLGIQRMALGVALMAVGGAVSMLVSDTAVGSAVPAAQQRTIVTGTMQTRDIGNLGVRRFEFSAGSRYYWHTHNWAPQVLMMENGKGLVQVRGGPVILLLPNQPIIIPKGVEHWHGAAPDEGGVQWNIYDGLGVSGSVTWGDSVTAAEYNATPVHLATQSTTQGVQFAWQAAVVVNEPTAGREEALRANPSR
jgi:quercetin dioxygenase-like cupin family protein